MVIKRDPEYDAEEIKRRCELPSRADNARSPFEIDRARIIHSAAFRRLQGKTQVFGLSGSDFFRTRLTHSLEVAQIGKGIALRLGANTDLVEAAGLAHDIGHPPFGHAGELALAEQMSSHGGFEANAQNIRILRELEVKHPRFQGLNLTQATCDAILKYKLPFSEAVSKLKKKFYYNDDQDFVAWASEGSPNGETRSLECEIMEWADDIAYSTHDLEDGIKAGMITKLDNENKLFKREARETWESEEQNPEWNEEYWNWAGTIIERASYTATSYREAKANRKEAIAGVIDSFVKSTDLVKRDQGNLPSRYKYELRIDPKWDANCRMLKLIVRKAIISDERITTLALKAQKIVDALFCDFTDWKRDPQLMLPDDFRELFNNADASDQRYRVVCDYISGMTDTYAARVFSRLRESEASPLFDIL